MHHKFDPRNRHKLESAERRKALPPHEILTLMGLKTGQSFLDIGAGTGFFSFPAAEIVGDKGFVTAIDISPEMVKDLRKRIRDQDLSNLRVLQSRETGFDVSENSIDFAFMSCVFHEVENKQAMVVEIKRVLRPENFVGIVEWIKKPMEKGPALADRISRAEAADILTANGFEVTTDRNYSEHHYIVVAQLMP